MRPVLAEIFGLPINSYGASKALAALMAPTCWGASSDAWMGSRACLEHGDDHYGPWFRRREVVLPGRARGESDTARLRLLGVHLVRRPDRRGRHRCGDDQAVPASFGAVRRHRGCPARLGLRHRTDRLLLGRGRHLRQALGPYRAMAFPNGTMPTLVPVHPTALYESAFAFVLAALLWWVRNRIVPLAVFGLYAVLSGTARFLVEEVRINKEVLLGMTQPQLWSLVLVVVGAYLLVTRRRSSDGTAPAPPDEDDLRQKRSCDRSESVHSPSATR